MAPATTPTSSSPPGSAARLPSRPARSSSATFASSCIGRAIRKVATQVSGHDTTKPSASAAAAHVHDARAAIVPTSIPSATAIDMYRATLRWIPCTSTSGSGNRSRHAWRRRWSSRWWPW
jgi:hypothetical protein